MSQWQDTLTSTIKIATDILFVRNPVGTSLGVLFGVVLHGIMGLVSPLLESVQQVRISAIGIGHYIAVGIFSFNISGFLKSHEISPEIDQAIALIEQQVTAGEITRSEAVLYRKHLISRVIESVQLDAATQARVSAIENILAPK